MKIKILVCCFKDNTTVDNENYLPIQVGKKNITEKLNITGDDTGDNISDKNGSYCELTGVYWAWKNLKDIDYIGLCHYRRFFDFTDPKFSLPIRTIGTNTFNNLEFEVPQNVIQDLQKGKVILPKRKNSKLSLYADYCMWHNSEDIRTLEDIIGKSCEEKYSAAYKKVMYGNEFSPYNMFLMSWKEYDKYCNWLFSVLGEVESTINTSFYNSYQKRMIGFMAERLLNIYIEANQLDTKEYPILFVSDENTATESYLKYKIKTFYNKIVSRSVNLRRTSL